jgi:hypothetical protein
MPLYPENIPPTRTSFGLFPDPDKPGSRKMQERLKPRSSRLKALLQILCNQALENNNEEALKYTCLAGKSRMASFYRQKPPDACLASSGKKTVTFVSAESSQVFRIFAESCI